MSRDVIKSLLDAKTKHAASFGPVQRTPERGSAAETGDGEDDAVSLPSIRGEITVVPNGLRPLKRTEVFALSYKCGWYRGSMSRPGQ